MSMHRLFVFGGQTVLAAALAAALVLWIAPASVTTPTSSSAIDAPAQAAPPRAELAALCCPWSVAPCGGEGVAGQ